MVRDVPVMWLRFADRCARGSGAGAAAHEASASAASSSRRGRVREGMARRAHGSRPGAVTAQHPFSYPAPNSWSVFTTHKKKSVQLAVSELGNLVPDVGPPYLTIVISS